MKLNRRKIYGDSYVGGPIRKCQAGAPDDPVPDRVDQSGLLGDWNEFAGRYQSTHRVLPAQQRLESGEAVFVNVKKWLVDEKQLVPFYCPFKVPLQRPAVACGYVVSGLEEAGRARPGFLCAMKGDVGTFQQVTRGVAIARRQHDAD